MNDDLYQHLPVLPDRITNVPAGEEVNIGLIDAPPANPLRDSRFNIDRLAFHTTIIVYGVIYSVNADLNLIAQRAFTIYQLCLSVINEVLHTESNDVSSRL